MAEPAPDKEAAMSTTATQTLTESPTLVCRHRWFIETPHGATSRGVCRRCGAARDFPNAAEDIMPEPVGGFLRRYASDRRAVRSAAKDSPAGRDGRGSLGPAVRDGA